MPARETLLKQLDPCNDVATGAAALAAALEHADAQRGTALAAASFLRVEVPIESGEPLAWLRRHAGLPRLYWSDRESELELACVGTATAEEGRDLDGLETLRARVFTGEAADRILIVGTARFDLDREPAPEWQSFKRAQFVLPLLELRRDAEGLRLAVNLRVEGTLTSGWYDVQRRTAIKALTQGAPVLHPPDTITPKGRDDDLEGWAARIAALLERIRDGSLAKAVLARRASLVMELDPIDVLEALREAQPLAYHMLVQPAVGEALVAASPERLYRRRGLALETEALAGTRARQPDGSGDEALAADLTGSPKDGAEHALVREHVLAALGPLTDELDAADTPAVRTLASLLHLHTPVRASLKSGVTDAMLLGALHPTPAVGGVPSERARAFLRDLEPFDRGLYAGPIGVFGRHEADVAVALRCATLRGHWVQLFAGAGVVDGSDAAAEWQETADKMHVLGQVLETLDGR